MVKFSRKVSERSNNKRRKAKNFEEEFLDRTDKYRKSWEEEHEQNVRKENKVD